MNKWHVIYKEKDAFGSFDFDIFRCRAEDMDHAKEQCLDAYPDCQIVWADIEENPEETIKNYLSISKKY